MISFFKHFFKTMFKADSKPCTLCHRLATMNEDGGFPASHVIVYQCYYSTSFGDWKHHGSHPEKYQTGFQARSRTVLNTALRYESNVRQFFIFPTSVLGSLLLAWFLASHFFFYPSPFLQTRGCILCRQERKMADGEVLRRSGSVGRETGGWKCPIQRC